MKKQMIRNRHLILAVQRASSGLFPIAGWRKSLPAITAMALGCWSAQAAVVFNLDAGADYLRTIPGGTVFLGQHWEGVPVSPGGYDTVMTRLQDIHLDVGESATIGLQMTELQLKSVNSFDPDGFGPAPDAYYFITLNGSPQPIGSMTLNVNAGGDGTMDTSFNVNFQVHVGALDGPIVPLPDQDCFLEAAGIPWHWNVPSQGWAGGVTFFENGTWTTSHDSSHEVIPVPEPPSLTAASLITLLGIAGYGYRRHRAKEAA